MTLSSIIHQAATVYPEILDYWDESHNAATSYANPGDSLAGFIASEIAETYDPAASDGVQIMTAIGVLRRATEELESVIAVLQEGMPVRLVA